MHDHRGGAVTTIVSEPHFLRVFLAALEETDTDACGFVVGPGRSGAIASVYASHHLRIPFIPYGAKAPIHLGRALVVDTAVLTGATMRKAARRYKDADPVISFAFNEPPRVRFWYECEEPQLFRHENKVRRVK